MSRRNATSSALRHRPSRAVPALLVGILMFAVGVGLVWVSILYLINGSWPAFVNSLGAGAAALTWTSPVTWVIIIAGAVVGLVLFLAAVIPGSHNAATLHLPPAGSAAETDMVMTKRSIARLATAEADLVDGVDQVAATVTTRRLHLSIKTPTEHTEGVQAAVAERVRNRLQAIGLHPMPRISATAHHIP